MNEKGNDFLSVLNTWPEYFKNMHEGLGTTYERFILHRYFKQMQDKFGIESVLEAPSFGMTGVSGINSLWWAAQGITPVVLDDNEQRISQVQQVWDSIPLPVDLKLQKDWTQLPFEQESFDFSWNFASLWFAADAESFAKELARVTKKVIFICVPNIHGIGYKLRRRYNEIPRDLHTENIHPKNIKILFNDQGWQTWKSGYLDIPPWPDIAMKKEDLFPKIGLGFLLKKEEPGESGKRTCIVDYFNGKRPALEEEILKFAFMEKAPSPIKQVWAHHRWFIFTKPTL